MSQSTELPDLDRLSELSDEALGALKPWVVRQIISVASRAKPEGEAPQADWQAYALNLRAVLERGYKSLASASMARTRDGEAAWYAMGEALAVMPPAAQHAESGAPAPDAARVDAIVTGLYRRFKEWSKRGFGPDDVTWCEVKADVIELIASGGAVLAAQSQGAQAADAYLTCLSVACSFDHDSRERHAAMDCVRAVQAAQQAAAPGAEGKYAKALRNLLLDVECGILDGDARREARDLLDSEDDSAPGTPEAPKPPFPISDDEMAALRRFWECATDGEGYDVEKPMMQRLAEMGLVQRKSGAYYMATEFGLYVLGEYTMERAAQLDGGQEEGKAHA